MQLFLLVRSIFRIRSYSNYQLAPFPAYFVSIAISTISFIAYSFGSAAVEYELRVTFLITIGFFALVLLVHLLHHDFARWVVVFSAIALVFLIAGIWDHPALLYLLVIPVILSAILINFPAIVITSVLESLLVIFITQVVPGAPRLALSRPEQTLLLLTVWLSALAIGAGSILIEQLFGQLSIDYNRMQSLLESSRVQQQKLSETLDDLSHVNRQLSLLYDKNISLRKVAEEATEAKTGYIARVSHEIRTPLNMILGITESIIENQEVYGDDIPLDLVDDIHTIRRNSEHLLSLVNDVLDLTRAEANQLVLRREWADIAVEIEKSIEIVLPLARKKRLDISAELLAQLPQVFCDRTRIRQAILNLLSNAVRYTERGQVRVSTSADDKWLTVCVKDTGPGILPEDTERIFEPFYRGQSGSHSQTAGTGLGLSVSRQFVELHGGKMWLESQAGSGTCFYFRLPLIQNEAPARSPVSFVNERWVWVERKPSRQYNFTLPQEKRVAVCTPDEKLVNQINQLGLPVEFVRVNTVDELIQEVETTPASLVLINAASPDELTAAMDQATQSIKDTPVIGSTFTSLREQVLKTGAADYVQKPFSNQQLRQAVERQAPDPKQILIVDDNTDVQKLVTQVLNSQYEGLQYLLANNGSAALEILQRKTPDLILLDLALPDIDGWQLLSAIKKDPGLRDIPVIIVSAHDLSDSPNRSKALVFMHGEGITVNELVKLFLENHPG